MCTQRLLDFCWQVIFLCRLFQRVVATFISWQSRSVDTIAKFFMQKYQHKKSHMCTQRLLDFYWQIIFLCRLLQRVVAATIQTSLTKFSIIIRLPAFTLVNKLLNTYWVSVSVRTLISASAQQLSFSRFPSNLLFFLISREQQNKECIIFLKFAYMQVSIKVSFVAGETYLVP